MTDGSNSIRPMLPSFWPSPADGNRLSNGRLRDQVGVGPDRYSELIGALKDRRVGGRRTELGRRQCDNFSCATAYRGREHVPGTHLCKIVRMVSSVVFERR